jgi:hypothetical protein
MHPKSACSDTAVLFSRSCHTHGPTATTTSYAAVWHISRCCASQPVSGSQRLCHACIFKADLEGRPVQLACRQDIGSIRAQPRLLSCTTALQFMSKCEKCIETVAACSDAAQQMMHTRTGSIMFKPVPPSPTGCVADTVTHASKAPQHRTSVQQM